MSNPYSTPTEQNSVQPSLNRVQEVRGLKIITFALAMGVLIFMGICLVKNQGALDGGPNIVSWVGLGFAIVMYAAHLVIPNIITAAALKQVDADELRNADEDEKFSMIIPAFRIRHIIACAMLEGAAFFNLICYLVTQFMGNLAAAAALLVLIALRFPSVSSVTFWVQDRTREIEMN